MSEFSSQLRIALERSKMTRAELAAACGIPYSTLTNYAREIRPADPAAMLAICKALPEHEAAQLIVARLRDECPEEIARLVLIEARTQTLEEPQKVQMPELDSDARAAIEVLAYAAHKSEAWHAVLIDLAAVIAPERFKKE